MEQINTGVTENDPTADSIRDAFIKVNNNTNELINGGPTEWGLKFVDDTISTTPINTTGDIKLIPGIGGKVFIEKLDVDILNVYDDVDIDNLTVNTITGGTSITVPNINATIKVTCDTLEANTLTLTNPINSLSTSDLTTFTLKVDDDATIARSLIVTDGQAVNPQTQFSVDGISGRTTIGTVLNLPLETSPVSQTGQVGDKKGDIRIDNNYIYVCFEDWVDNSPNPQPDIWGRSSLTWLP